MCLPVAALSALQMAGSVIGTVMQFQQQQEAADAQNAANAEQRRQIREQQAREQMDAARQRSQQWEQDAAEANAYAADHRKQFATLDALIGEGAGGNTAQRKMAAMGIAQGQDLATLAANSTRARSEISLGENSRLQSGNNQLASIKDTKGPSALGAALSIGGAAVSYGKDMGKVAGNLPGGSGAVASSVSSSSPYDRFKIGNKT